MAALQWKSKSKSYYLQAKENPKDRIEVELGDSKDASSFFPQVKIMRWDNEVNASFRLKDFNDFTITTEREKIKLVNTPKEVHLYDYPQGHPDHPEGGYEFEVILKEKPASNVLEFSLETKGLDFFYQPPLTQKEIDEGAKRPENVVGSYAVYHKTKGGLNRSDGMEYKVGKFCHIYRPKFKDAEGKEVWGELNIDVDKKLLTITIDQTWLDNAVYPVVVDPTFGYTSHGATTGTFIASTNAFGAAYSKRSGCTGVPGLDGTLDSITFWAKCTTSQSIDISVFVNQENSGGSGSHGQIASAEDTGHSFTTDEVEHVVNLNSEEINNGIDYIPNVCGDAQDLIGNSQHVYMCYDSATGDYYYENIENGYATLIAENPWTNAGPATTAQLSLYATYTAAGGEAEATNARRSLLGVGL